MNCNDAMAALVASLEEGTPMSAIDRSHVRDCPRCRTVLEAAKQLDEEPVIAAPRVDDAVAAAEGELHRVRARRVLWAVGVICTSIAIAAGVALFPSDVKGDVSFGLWVLTMAFLISAGFFVPVLGVIYILRGTARKRIYKRLTPGRMIDGVCLGLAEKMGFEVNHVRLFFVALLFFAGGLGFWTYMAFDAAMPVHPDDRQYLRRFRIRRWWAARGIHAPGAR